ncbi:MAG: HdeD family acid-resistance protein [Xanthobacteraceae bacterium]
MSLSNPTLNKAERVTTEQVRIYWILFLVQGIIMMALGVLAIISPQISTLGVDLYVGWMFLFSGVIGLITMSIAPRVSAFLWSLVTAALSLLVGILLLWHPVEGAVSLTLVLIAFFIVEGIFQISAAIRHRDAFSDSWGWLLMSGIADLVLAAMIIYGWPATATWALGLIVGVNLITSGLAITMVAVAGRSLLRIAEKGMR